MSLALIVETNRGEGRDDFSFVGEDTVVTQDEVKDGGFGLGAIDVVLDVEGSDHIWRRETLDLTVEKLEPSSGGTARNTDPLLIARINVDFPVPFLPQRP